MVFVNTVERSFLIKKRYPDATRKDKKRETLST